MANKIYLTINEFILKAKEIHNNKYDYSLVNFVNYNEKVIITCPIHGNFSQRISSHLAGKNCRKCFQKNRHTDTNLIINRFRIIHGDFYDYSLVDYKNSNTKVRILCPLHGEFMQNPMAHARGRNCPKCKGPGSTKYNTKVIVAKFNQIHDNKYDYSLVNYENYDTKVIIKCSKHGEFLQKPGNHLRGYGCPKCKNGIELKLLNFLDENTIFRDRNFIAPLELDFLNLERKFAIEFNGILYHSYGINKTRYLNNINSLSTKNINKHLNKFIKCLQNNVNLMNINELYWYKYIDIISKILLKKSHRLETFLTIEIFTLDYIIDYNNPDVFKFCKENTYRLYSTKFRNITFLNKDNKIMLIILFEIINDAIYIDNIIPKTNIIIPNYIDESIKLIKQILPNLDIYLFIYNDLETYNNENFLCFLEPNEYYTSKKLKKLKIIINTKNNYIHNTKINYIGLLKNNHSGRFYYDTGWSVFLFRKELK